MGIGVSHHQELIMNRSLKKGMTSVYFQHENTGHSIGAKSCESEVVNDLAILRLTLAPVDGNQKSDEDYLHEEPLVSVSLNDEAIIEGFLAHIKQSSIKIAGSKLEIMSKGKKLMFEVSPDIEKKGKLNKLDLTVKNG